jgi:hypothetical protein
LELEEPAAPEPSPSVAQTEEEEKRRALRIPGPTWKEWFYFTALKWWLGLFFLIIDSWVVVAFLEAGSVLGLVAATAAAVYLEYLLYVYLWRRPELERSRARARRWPPVEVGRWTPEAFAARAAGTRPTAGSETADPREFL